MPGGVHDTTVYDNIELSYTLKYEVRSIQRGDATY